jgi:hypothetical protein
MQQGEDLFDSIVFLEEEFQEMGRKEALNDPNFGHDEDSFALGAKNGFEFFRQVGFYVGFAEEALQQKLVNLKAVGHLEAIVAIGKELSMENEENVDPHRDLKLIQGHFKVACSLLKINLKYSADEKAPNLSF